MKSHFSIRFFRRFLVVLAFFACLISQASCVSLGSQPGPEKEENKGAAAPERNYTGLAGKRSPEAETAFDQARVLWRGAGTSASLGERCSDPAKAVALLDKAIALDPEFGEAYTRRALARSDLGENEKAFEDATRGIRLSSSAEAYAARGLVLLRSHEGKAARRDFEYSLKKKPSQHQAYNYLGVLGLSEGDNTSACRSFREGCSKGDCSFLESARKEKICP